MQGESSSARGAYRLAAALLASLCALAVAGCGGRPDEGEAREVAATYLQATADADDEALCSSLSHAERKRVEMQSEASGGSGDCITAVDELDEQFEDYAAELRARAEAVDDSILIAEDSAATITFPVSDGDSDPGSGAPRALFLVEQDGEWKVDDQTP